MKNINSTQLQLSKFRKNIQECKTNIAKNSALESLVTTIVGAEFCSIWIYDEHRAILVRKRDENFVRELSMNEKSGVIYKAFMTKKAGVYNNLSTEIEYVDLADNPDNINMKSKIILPLLEDNKLIGIATAYSSVESMKDFSRHDFNLFKIITPYIISTLHEMREYKGVERRSHIKCGDDSVSSNIEILETQEIQKEENPQDLIKYVSSIVHDIRTPANSLYGFLDLLEEKIDDPRLRQYVSNAKASASFINDLTTSILDKASDRVVETPAASELVNSSSFFSKISELFVSNMYKKNISFNVFIDPLIPREIEVETLKLKRTIMNLIGNAYKFTPTDECIEFSVRYKPKDKKIHIFVKDSGIGIVKAKQQEIFEAFKQAESDTNEKYGGHGLGLSICAGFVKEMGGKLSIDSTLNEGSTFYFDIPISRHSKDISFKTLNAKDIKIAILMDTHNKCSANNIARYLVRMGIDSNQIKAYKNFQAIGQDTTHLISFEGKLYEETIGFCNAKNISLLRVEENLFSMETLNELDPNLVISQYGYFADTLYAFVDTNSFPRVLIVDDNHISISLLKNILDTEYCEIDTASSGERALELLALSIKSKRAYSVVYLDKYMDGISGDDVLHRLRILEKNSDIEATYVVSVSGDKNENGAYDNFIGKPFSKEKIRHNFNDVINAR